MIEAVVIADVVASDPEEIAAAVVEEVVDVQDAAARRAMRRSGSQ